MMTENIHLGCWNNFDLEHFKAGRTSPVYVAEEVISSNKAYKAKVIVLDPDWKIPAPYIWNIKDAQLKPYFDAYMDYYYKENLHRYPHDHNQFGHYPFAFFSVGTLNRGIITSPGMIKTYTINGSSAYDMVVPNWS